LDLVRKLSATLNGAAMDDRHAPKLYSRFLLGLVKKAEKILAKGSNASTASSPASTTAMHNGSSPATYPRDIAMNNSMNMSMYTGDMASPSNTAGTFANQYSADSGQPQVPQNPTSQAQYQFDDSNTFGMDDVQTTLPQNTWPHNSASAGDGDTLMHMRLFGDQFWEDVLLPGFSGSWGDSTAGYHGDNVVRDYSNVVPPEIQVSFENPLGYVPPPQVNQQPYFQGNPMQAFPNMDAQQQQQQQQNQYQFQPNGTS